jgi:hypothetical protein
MEPWRDENKLPLRELKRAMATNSDEGQVDDVTGGDAGSAAVLGTDPDSTDQHRELRPSPDGPAGGRLGPA